MARTRHELEQLRRSLAAMPHGQPALRREEARQLLDELLEAQGRYDDLVAELRRIVDGG